jgi:hypothetical protein
MHIHELGQFENDTAENRLKYTAFIVEADSFAQHQLWAMHANNSQRPLNKDRVIKWEQLSGWGIHVGFDNKRPVMISLMFNRINDKLVAFWYPMSQIVNHKLVDKWFDKHFKGKWDKTRRATCDASNFHHCLDAIEKLNKNANDNTLSSISD